MYSRDQGLFLFSQFIVYYYLLLVQVTRDMLTESVAIVPGFTSYFAFSRLRSGYSGVATFCRSSATPAQSDSSLAQASMLV